MRPWKIKIKTTMKIKTKIMETMRAPSVIGNGSAGHDGVICA
jgi:hypothetical protein